MSQTYSANDLVKGIRATLTKRMLTHQSVLQDLLCERMTSLSDEEKHLFSGASPQVTEWKGSRKTTPIVTKATTIENKIYDASVRLSRDDMRRSKGGELNIQRQLRKLENAVLGFPNKRITDLLVNGTGVAEHTPFDGVSFFNDSHPAIDASGGFDNLLAGSGTSTANIATDINEAFKAFGGFLDTNGEPFFGDMELEVVFVHGPLLRKAFTEALEAEIISNTTNKQKGTARAIENRRLTDTDDFYAFVTNPGFKPLIWQDEQPLEIDVAMENDPELWNRQRQAEVGASVALGAGYAYPQSALKFVNS